MKEYKKIQVQFCFIVRNLAKFSYSLIYIKLNLANSSKTQPISVFVMGFEKNLFILSLTQARQQVL